MMRLLRWSALVITAITALAVLSPTVSAQLNRVAPAQIICAAGGIIVGGNPTTCSAAPDLSVGALTFPGGSVLNGTVANDIFQRNGTNAQRLSVANTYTSSTNYEAFSVDWQTTANLAIVGTRTAATGTTRNLMLAAQGTNAEAVYGGIFLSRSAPFILQGLMNASGTGSQSSSTASTLAQFALVTSTATSGTVNAFAVTPTYNQSSGTAANTDLLINRTQTAVGSGVQRLVDLQIGGTSKHHVTADGTAKGTQEVFTQATAPTCTSANNCGTGNGTFATGSSDTSGTVTLGTTPASGFVITFTGTWAAAPVCQVWMAKAGMAVGKIPLTTVTTATTITVVTNGVAPSTGDIYSYRCTGLQ